MFKVFCFFLLFCIPCCVSAVPTDEITHMLARQEAAWNTGDIDTYMQGYWRSEKLRIASGKKFRYGWQETLDAFKKYYSTRALMGKLQLTQVEIKVFNNSAAMVVGRWQLIRAKDKPEGLFTLLLEKIDDRWVITHDHTSE
ncbi:DUF4440 domain-containing protein [Shewanella sp. AS1]|uniref:YybH family protein n=1 Tax=Shewanella sp. AS1 TaxID=2907626 RepID=UPI001F3A31DA|nr:nuclear transport factor 2 family protein [Shewanella sp. AS1]MCE9680535.1 DUF4440 domain-containing protein [Shewanella sp. AS1]